MTIPEKIQINWSEWLKKLLSGYGLWSIEVPKFDQIIELTQSELNELKEKLMKKTLEGISLKDAVSQIIKEKLDWTKKTVESAVTSITWQETALLKEKVSKWENHIASQIEAIKSIDVNKRISEINPDTLSTYDAWLVLLIGQLANSGVKKTDLAHSYKFKEFIQDKSLDPTMKQISDKTIEILDSQNDMLVRHVASSWTKIVDMAYVNSPSIKEASNYMALWKMIPEWNFIWDFANKYPKSFSLLAVSGALLSLWFIWKMLFWWWDKNNNKEWWKESWWFFSKLFDKFKWWLLWWAWIFWILWLWKMVWVDQIKEYVKKNLGIDVDETRLLKAMESYKKWEYMEMIKILVFWTEKIEKAKESDAFYSSVMSDIHNKWYSKKLRSWEKIDHIKSIAWWNTNDFLNWFGSWLDLWRSIFWKENEELSHIQILREYIIKETKSKKINIEKKDTVEYTLKQILWKDKVEQSTTSSEIKSWEPPKETIVEWAIATAWVWTALAMTPPVNEQVNDNDKKNEWEKYSSLDNPVLYYWSRWVSYGIRKVKLSNSIRRYLSQLQWNEMKLPQTREKIRELQKMDTLLNKPKLNESEKKILAWLLDKHHEFIKLPLSAKTYVDVLESNPELKKELLKEEQKLRASAKEYHEKALKLKNEKFEKVQKLEMELIKKKKMWKWEFMNLNMPLTSETYDSRPKFQNPFKVGTNEYNDFNILRNKWLEDIKKIDFEMEELSKKHGFNMSDSNEKINNLIKKYNIKDADWVIKRWFFGGLEKVWYKIEKIRWVSTWKTFFRIWFAGLMLWTLVNEFATWDDNFWLDATEVWFWILPITSEILDFTAALRWKDLAWRDLISKDRWIRAWFGVVWTLADAATLVTFWQSEWLRVWLAWVKWTAKVADIAKDAKTLEKVKQWIFELVKSDKYVGVANSEKLLKTVKYANKGWHVLTFWALWIATYDAVQNISVDDVIDWAKNAWNKVKSSIVSWKNKN